MGENKMIIRLSCDRIKMSIMNAFPFFTTNQYLKALRIAIGLMLLAHGAIRVYAGTVGGFGEFLNAKGFLIGAVIAWGITVYEIAGGLLLARGLFKKWICAGFIIILTMGILLVHMNNGWFVVGYGSGGAEYSVLLILCLLLIASTEE